MPVETFLIVLVLKETATIMLIVLPLLGRIKEKRSGKIQASNWVVNQNGKLQRLSGKETDPNILK
jgi:hypothetical protein